MLDKDFIFSYHDYDQGVDKSWARNEEMIITYVLFQNVQRLDLIWNDFVSVSGDSTRIRRSFNLTVTFDPMYTEFADGKVNLELIKSSDQRWKILRWYDESNY